MTDEFSYGSCPVCHQSKILLGSDGRLRPHNVGWTKGLPPPPGEVSFAIRCTYRGKPEARGRASRLRPPVPRRPRARSAQATQLGLFLPPASRLGSAHLFTVTVQARRADGSALPWQYRVCVDARGAVEVWQSVGANRRAVAGWKGRWKSLAVTFWWHGLRASTALDTGTWADLEDAVWAQLRAQPAATILDDKRFGWHRTAPPCIFPRTVGA